MMRAVLDTNVVISALIWGGKPFALIEAASAGNLLLNTSPALMAELCGVLSRVHFTSRLESRRSSAEQAMALYARLAAVMDPAPLTVPVSRDPDDDAVLALAVAARAEMIVSGDGDLLVLGAFGGIRIVTPAEALGLLRA